MTRLRSSARAEVVCLRHEEPDVLGVGVDALREAGLGVRYVDLWREDCPDAEDAAGVIALGGVMNADQTDAYPFLAAERSFLRACTDAGVPVLGICLGGQVLARSWGAEVAAGTAREVGFHPVGTTPWTRADPVLCVFPDGARVFRWHDDGFAVPPAGRLLLTGGDVSPNQAFRAGSGWALQFHPELTSELLGQWLDLVGDRLLDEYGRTRREVEDEAARWLPEQQRLARAMFRRFADVVRAS